MNTSPKQTKTDVIEIPTFVGSVPCELSADYILPDIYPDVKKILRVNAVPVLISRFISGQRLEFTGAVDYSVLFSAESENGDTLHSVHFAADFTSSLGEPEGHDTANIDFVPRIASCTAKCANPRKLTIKSTVMCDVKITSSADCAPICSGAGSSGAGNSLETLTKTVLTCASRTFVTEPLKISDSIELDSSMPTAEEVICCDAAICFTDVHIGSDSSPTVTMKGNVAVHLIYKADDGGKYRTVSRKLPFSASVNAHEYSDFVKALRPDSLTASAFATPIEIATSVTENASAEKRCIELDISAEMTVKLSGVCESRLTTDAYSTERDCECSFADYEYFSPIRTHTSNFTVSESIDRELMKLPESAVVADMFVKLSAPKPDPGRVSCVLTSEAEVSFIITDADGNLSEYSHKTPVKYELPFGELNPPLDFECFIEASDLRARLDSRKLNFDFEVNFTANAAEKHRRRAVCDITLSGERRQPPEDFEITLCYRLPDETLWDVAKRYKTTVKAIETANRDSSRIIMVPGASVKSFLI